MKKRLELTGSWTLQIARKCGRSVHGQAQARAFTEEFKAETVRLIRESGKSIGWWPGSWASRECGAAWVRQAGIDAGQGRRALTTEEREELGRCGASCGGADGARHLKKSDAFFAKESE